MRFITKNEIIVSWRRGST